ncbi:mRNA export factor GLE1-like isoform X1 [Typha angustifolia]|uniref:mRNA export factor GLE1-like isoform X1 n=1 Tax=Typha angustifolia TaxID=59011 RepID=UPI003C2C7DA7
MGFIKLELPRPKNSPAVPSPDPDPNWTLDDLLSELNSLELQLGGARSSLIPSPLKQKPDWWSFTKERILDKGMKKPFIMYVSDDDTGDDESEDELDGGMGLVTGTRFSCNDLYLSEFEESDDELQIEAPQSYLMAKKCLEEGILFDLESEHWLNIKEEVKSKLAALEVYHKNEIDRASTVIDRLMKHTEVRREMDRRLDKQYQRKIAEVLDKHLSSVQRDHEQRSQIEERKIRDEAALEEAIRKEKAFNEEKAHQERARQEAEARHRAAKLVEEAKKAALEAAAKEAAEKESARMRENAAAEVKNSRTTNLNMLTTAETKETTEGNSISNKSHSGMKVFAADAALEAEANRLRLYNEGLEKNHLNKDFGKYERRIARYLRQIIGTVDNVRTKARELINIMNDSECPRSIAVSLFAEKVVSLCENNEVKDNSFDKTAFACGHVILLVTSQVPAVMDRLLAELNKACIYTVPKHLQPTDAASRRKDYCKMIGYREESGKIESDDAYLLRVISYMKLYAALIQTEINGFRNPLGLKEGWKWLAMFLNTLPANTYTATALEAFLKMAGFALFRRYRSQFRKILNVISRTFVPALKAKGDKVKPGCLRNLEHYLDNKIYLQEPEGWRLSTSSLLSREFVV